MLFKLLNQNSGECYITEFSDSSYNFVTSSAVAVNNPAFTIENGMTVKLHLLSSPLDYVLLFAHSNANYQNLYVSNTDLIKTTDSDDLTLNGNQIPYYSNNDYFVISKDGDLLIIPKPYLMEYLSTTISAPQCPPVSPFINTECDHAKIYYCLYPESIFNNENPDAYDYKESFRLFINGQQYNLPASLSLCFDFESNTDLRFVGHAPNSIRTFDSFFYLLVQSFPQLNIGSLEFVYDSLFADSYYESMSELSPLPYVQNANNLFSEYNTSYLFKVRNKYFLNYVHAVNYRNTLITIANGFPQNDISKIKSPTSYLYALPVEENVNPDNPCQSYITQIDNLQHSIELKNLEIQNFDNQISNLNSSIIALTSEKQTLQDQNALLTDLKQQLSSNSSATINALNIDKVNLTNQINNLVSEKTLLTSERDSLISLRDSLQVDLHAKDLALTAKTTEFDICKLKRDELTQQIVENEAYLISARDSLSEALAQQKLADLFSADLPSYYEERITRINIKFSEEISDLEAKILLLEEQKDTLLSQGGFDFDQLNIPAEMTTLNGNGSEFKDGTIVNVEGRNFPYAVIRSYFVLVADNTYSVLYDLGAENGSTISAPESMLSVYVNASTPI